VPEISFDCVGVHVAAHVLFRRVLNRAVLHAEQVKVVIALDLSPGISSKNG
jgi:hypothetical protein